MLSGAICWSTAFKIGRSFALFHTLKGQWLNLFDIVLDVVGGFRSTAQVSTCANVTRVESAKELQKKRLVLIEVALETSLARQVLLVNLSRQIGLRFEDGQAIIKSVEFEEVLNKFCHECAVLGLTELFGFGVLEVERTASLLDLVLIVDDFEDARA